jgi:aminoglycoside 6'-N-acetyltransferase
MSYMPTEQGGTVATTGTTPTGSIHDLKGERVCLRPLTLADVPRIAEIIAHPEVERWWTFHDEDRLRAELFEDDSVVPFAVELDGDIVGLIEYSEQRDPDCRSAGVDIALDPALTGQGFGPDALRTLIRFLFDERGHHRVTIDPACENDRAIAAYRKVGFKPVGVMRQYERTGTGEWRDSLLMDLLRDEFNADGGSTE